MNYGAFVVIHALRHHVLMLRRPDILSDSYR
jgi:hypothetical protein